MKYYGQWETDKVIETYFPNQDTGLCVEVGAYDGVTNSNSFYFHLKGFCCICIEPNPNIFPVLKTNRYDGERCVCIEAACGSESCDDRLTIFHLHDGKESAVTSLIPDERLVESHNDRDLIKALEIVPTKVVTLNDILDSETNVKDIDFISIDTENTELDVLKGLDLNKYNVKLLVVENNFDDPKIGEYLLQFGYVRDQRYRVNDFYIKGEG